MSTSDKNASHQKVKEQTDELRTKYPRLIPAVLERIPDMDLKGSSYRTNTSRACKACIENSCYEIDFHRGK